jgi:hypothetical protein
LIIPNGSWCFNQPRHKGGKKMANLAKRFILLAAVAIFAIATGCSSKDSAEPVASTQEKQPAAAAEQPKATAEQQAESAQPVAQVPSMEAKPMTLSGTVEETDAGIVIASDLGKFLVTGHDLSDMIGKTVNVTGTIQESAGSPTIEITSVEAAE